MKIGTVVSIFEPNWQTAFRPLLEESFDFFEVLPENSSLCPVEELKEFFGNRELIFHAPFIQANPIAHDPFFRQAALDYLVKELTPLVEAFSPKVITTHLGNLPFIYPEVNYEAYGRLLEIIPSCTVENMPGGTNLWKRSYPATEDECDQTLEKLGCQMTFDVGHFMKQDVDVYKLLEKYLPQIADIHLHDIVDGKDHLELGTGELDLEKFILILKKADYQNYVSIELHHDNVPGILNSYRLIKEVEAKL